MADWRRVIAPALGWVVLSIARAAASPSVVQDAVGYNSWPMVQAVGDRLVCAYSRGKGHDVIEGGRGVYARFSDDFGRTWSDEVKVVDEPDFGESAVGKGLDEKGAMLLWVRSFSKDGKRQLLYRSTDGRRFEFVSAPPLDPVPVQVTDVFSVPGRGLMALWFSGWLSGTANSWGTLVSADNGRTWKQTTVETVRDYTQFGTEPSAVHLGGGRILAVARTETDRDDLKRQYQLTSADCGRTWKRRRTNIADVHYSTPSLIYDRETGLVYNYHYERGKGLLKRRVCRASEVFDRPDAWPDGEVIGTGGKSPPDSGNANATAAGGRHFVAYYSGNAPDTGIFVQQVPSVSVKKVQLGDMRADGRPKTRWRGFNLGEMCAKTGETPPPFYEETFRLIRELGFNFARIPLDYRYWIEGDDWEAIREDRLAPLDRAIEYAQRHGVHVLICLHRCPGYSVARPSERESLFRSENARRVCALHWKMLARHYRDVPAGALSFNLVNEPSGVSDEQYAKVARTLIEAVRSEDPKRFIVSDGLRWGRDPEPSLEDVPGVGFALRGYDPMSLTHYRAEWTGSPSAEPVWGFTDEMPRGVMFGPAHGDAAKLVIENVPAGIVGVEYGKCFGPAEIEFVADGKAVMTRALKPERDNANWYEVVDYPEWGGVSGYYRGRDTLEFDRPVDRLEARTTKGDWTSFNSIRIKPKGGASKAILWFWPGYGKGVNYHQRVVRKGGGFAFETVDPVPLHHLLYEDGSRDWLYANVFRAWDGAIADGAFVFCGEFGVYRHTPHAVTLRYMEDLLALCKERNIGWAMWQLSGPNGILDSGREDVEYEDFHGHKLDRKMLELLQRY